MDEHRFDALARALGVAGSRRRLVGGVFGGLAGAFALEAQALADRRKGRRPGRAKRRLGGGETEVVRDRAAEGNTGSATPLATESGFAHHDRGKHGKRHADGGTDVAPKKKRKKCKGGTSRCGKACVNLQADAANCGACDHACDAGQACGGGICGDTTCNGCRDGGSCRNGASDAACGKDGSACAVCDGGRTCVDGECACPGGLTFCDSRCADVQTDHAFCGSCITDCDSSETCCSGSCRQLGTNVNHCGACGRACDARRADRCAEGSCACGSGDPCGANEACCSGACVAIDRDPSQCGACGHGCDPAVADTCTDGTCTCGGVAPCDPATGRCEQGACACGDRSACLAGRLCCADACANPATDERNCGACGHVCDSAKADRCVGGQCRCGGGQPCGSGERCCGGVCVSTLTDMDHCGGCGRACAPRGSHCISGICKCSDIVNGAGQCAPGLTCCDTGICKNLRNDPNNCGTCFRFCPSGSCVDGVCGCGQSTCAAGFTCCGGVCLDMQRDANACGGCGTHCDTRFSDACTGGACTCGGGPACANGRRCCAGSCADIGSDSDNCGACGSVCPGANSGTANVACSTGACTFTCAGPNYDVNGDMADGCEYELPVANFTEAFALPLGSFTCNDGNVGSFRTTLASDARSHVPPVAGFDATVGAVPRWFSMTTTGGACANDVAVSMVSANATDGCYRITLMNGNAGFAQMGSCALSSGSCSFSGGSGSYRTGDVLYLKIERTCGPSFATEAATFDVRFHL